MAALKRFPTAPVLCALLLAMVSVASAVNVGEKAPDFTLPGTMGKDVSLKEFLGKKAVLIEFYGGDFAPV